MNSIAQKLSQIRNLFDKVIKESTDPSFHALYSKDFDTSFREQVNLIDSYLTTFVKACNKEADRLKK